MSAAGPGPAPAVADGELGRARQISGKLLPLLEFILARGLPTAVKSGFAELGVDTGVPRLPLQPLDAAGTEQLRTLLSDLDITAADVPAAS
ncbi:MULTISPECIES: dihydrodipicolinate synthase family protein [unclassified Saccharopolyspora]|uniref:dihydrodipicolinate synthase family protein n=1 Tax=unclassified Saccharopolyspora TaxID=2646250 RepID=UPI00210479E3|nr:MULTISPECIES: dihydrodipicolinate synthase family protein [unclassified Saccharopolyspora]